MSRHLPTFILSFWILSSCVQLKLETADTQSVDSAVGFVFDWSGASAAQNCDSVYVLMSRATQNVRYLFADASSASRIDSVALYGQYVTLVYACRTGDYLIAQREGFKYSGEINISDFSAQAYDLPAETVDELRNNSRIDFNASYKFISFPSEIYSHSVLCTVSDVGRNEFSLPMESLLTKLSLSLTIRTEGSVSINSICAELSGVPRSIRLKDRSTSPEDIERLIFPLQRATDGTCSTVLLVTGLYPSESDVLLTGPGILRLCVNASCSGVEKSFYPAINLREEIVSKNVMVPSTQSGRYVTSGRQLQLTVKEVLTITEDGFSGGNGGDGVTGWVDSNDYIDVDL
ncbi:MAG: hypothetical protein ACI39U_05975 [Candidatus Cryptobacteroides sp.]